MADEVINQEHVKAYPINVPQSDVAQALNKLAEQTDTVMLFSYQEAKARRSNRVIGYYTVMQAIDLLLEGSGLSGSLSKKGVIRFTVQESKHQNKKREENKTMVKSKKSILSTIIALIASTGSSIVSAQGDNSNLLLEEVLVTATKRQSTVQDLPFSINAQSQKDIERAGATNLEELSRNIAGLAIQNLGPGQSQVAIRGVSAGQVVRDQPGVKEQVGVYLDESVISLSLFTPDIDLYDLNRVETLRGPQGTLFGSGSMGGTLRYITNQPYIDSFEANVEVSASTVTDGEEGGHLKGMVNVPLGDNLAMRAVGYTTEYAGYIDAYREGGSKQSDVNGGNRTGGRLAFLWEPTDALTLTPRLIMQDINVDGFNRQEVFNVLANPYTTTRPAVVFNEREQHLALDEGFDDDLLITDLTVGFEHDSFDVTFVASYTDREILVTRDATALTGSVSIDVGIDPSLVTLPSTLLDATDIEQTTVELRFASNADGALQWIVGTFYSDTERLYGQTLPTPMYDAALDAVPGRGVGFSASQANGFGPDLPYASALAYDLEQIAVFGEFTYDLTDQLSLTLGGRFYDYEEDRQFSSGGFFSTQVTRADNTSSDGFNPRILASYELNDVVTLNAQAAQGFRLGGINDPLNANLCAADDLTTFGPFQIFDDETMWNYEAGFKARSGSWSFNSAIFYADISDLQVNLDAGACSSRVSVNVEESHSTGIETEFTSQITEQLYISFSASYTEAEFDSDVRDQNGMIIAGIQKGNRLASVPELQFSLASTYTFPFEVLGSTQAYISGSIQHIGDRYTQPGDQVAGAGNFVSGLAFGGATGTELTALDLELDAYETVNFSAGLVYDTWDAIFFVNNLTDENANLSFDRERNGRARLGFQTNQPRTIGLTFRKDF